jgi:hypothetical protein
LNRWVENLPGDIDRHAQKKWAWQRDGQKNTPAPPQPKRLMGLGWLCVSSMGVLYSLILSVVGFPISCTAAELLAKNLDHAHKTNEYMAAWLCQGGHN